MAFRTLNEALSSDNYCNCKPACLAKMDVTQLFQLRGRMANQEYRQQVELRKQESIAAVEHEKVTGKLAFHVSEFKLCPHAYGIAYGYKASSGWLCLCLLSSLTNVLNIVYRAVSNVRVRGAAPSMKLGRRPCYDANGDKDPR